MRTSDRFQKLGLYLKKKRIEANLTQFEVATKLGYNNSQLISNVERGLCGLPLNKLSTLAKIYSLDKRQLADILLEINRAKIYSVLKISNSK